MLIKPTWHGFKTMFIVTVAAIKLILKFKMKLCDNEL